MNVKAELEIELLHQKIDLLREQEIKQLLRVIEGLVKTVEARRISEEEGVKTD